tara:strand:+ start:2029 stop:2607 length:579 start_codon:yes stop_codon:yes gene_type:complete
MFAIVKDGVITRTGLSFRQLFPNTSFPSNGPNSAFRSENGVMEVVNAKQKNRAYYYVTQGDIVLVDGVPTQQYTNTAKRLVDEDAKDSDGKQLYVQVKNSDGDWVDSSEKIINQGLKTPMTSQVKTTANSILAKTDWMVIRKAERDVAIPSATVTYRAAVITECARLETAITNAADVDALAAVMSAQNWPAE